jgi:hypothetical protein
MRTDQAVLARFGEDRGLARITPELGGKRLGHGHDPSSEDRVPAGQESTELGAVPNLLIRL